MASKKKNRRLKKTIRKTLGTLFLISAIIVGAIPVDGLQAADGVPTVTVDSTNCDIPVVKPNETIYTTGDGQYQFAYVSPGASSNKVAVILGCNKSYLQGNALTIPDTLDAYLKYSNNLGTEDGYVAVGESGNFLFYAVYENKLDEYGEVITELVDRIDTTTGLVMKDEFGNNLKEEVPVKEKKFYPCYYRDYYKWGDLELNEFYYLASGTVSAGNAQYAQTTTSQYQRIQGAEVWYIGNQYLKEGEGDMSGTWSVAGTVENSSQGIFSGWGGIRSLTVGEKLSGIGNYAFYGCSGLESITLKNGLDTIGNWAFANCVNMTNINLDLYTNVDIIGDHAFYNCQALQNFRVPVSVTAIGDSAFEDCWALQEFQIGAEGANVLLNQLGDSVFKGCANLKSLDLPRTFTNDGKPLDVSLFEGCVSLEYIASSNDDLYFKQGDNAAFGFAEFKNTVPEEFYFEGMTDKAIHKMCTEQNIAFSHLGVENGEIVKLNLYEITKIEGGKKAVYRVNNNNELVYCEIERGMETVTMPNTIGPYKILVIEADTFQNKCSLKKITIPSSIESIASNAFKGCHNLEHVIFNEPSALTSIGDGAFNTQDCSFHEEPIDGVGCDGTITDKPVLYFTGPISNTSAAFQYAMSPANKINVGTQPETYITYFSGWPTNLEVRYNSETDRNELVDYPTFSELSGGTTYVVGSKYAYMTSEYETAAKEAVAKYKANDPTITDYERQIVNAALNIVLPDGIEAIQTGLFANSETDDITNGVKKTLTAYGLKEVGGAQLNEDGSYKKATVIDKDNNQVERDWVGDFHGCTDFTAIHLLGSETTSIGDYAFQGCSSLTDVSVPGSVATLGKRPFTECTELSHVNFQENPYFVCDNSIIFGLDAEGNKATVVEFLCGRDTGVVDASELETITQVAPEAFASTNVSSVDFRTSSLEGIPQGAFENTPKLFAVYLPDTSRTISKNAFKDSSIAYMEIPGSVSYIDNDAFSGTTDKKALQFYCEDGSNAAIYAKEQGIKTTSKPIELFYTVTFWDYDSTLLDTQVIAAGADAVPPEVPGRPGYIHTGWVPDYRGVNGDLQITAQYEAEDPDASKFTVTFLDHDDTVLKTTLVVPGGDAEPPFDPKREGYTFVGWRPAITNIQGNTTIYAQYEKNDSSLSQVTVRFIDHDDTVLYTQKVTYGGDAITPQNPTREGYVFTGWRPAITGITKDLDTYAQYEKIDGSGDTPSGDTPGGDTPNGDTPGADTPGGDTPGADTPSGDTPGDDNNGDSGQTTTKFYTLTVRNGSGSGSYAAGSQPIVIANDPAAGQEFSNWTIDPSDVTIASRVLTATVITMPEENVTITAHYKAKTGGSTTTGSGNSSNNNANRPNSNAGSIKNGGTTVVIDKNGLSNTGVVSATVNGSSDDFTIKITESSAASEAVVKALMAEYGDISHIKYFPMDITLYDATGKNKITDTSGLSISITLPLPDSLITYAGNNKVAGVVNDKLDKLTPKFTTISGVSCVTFTAEHFSPYVIYVDTNNLTAGTITDSTPKTGDGIHPKWFLSLGLACISMVLFMKKDRRTLQKRKVRA